MVSPDGVTPSRMAGVSASVNLPLHHKVQKFFSGTSSLVNLEYLSLRNSIRQLSLEFTDYLLTSRCVLHE